MKAELFRTEHAEQIPVPGYLLEHAIAVVDGETVLGVVGAHEDGDVVEIWAILSDEAKARPVALCHAAKVFVREMLLKHGHVRVRVVCETHRHWAERLGFVFDNDVGELKV